MYNYGEIKHWPPWIDNMTRLNHVLLALNSSINIVIYTAKVTFCSIKCKVNRVLKSIQIFQEIFLLVECKNVRLNSE